MPNPVMQVAQMGVDAFWRSLQSLRAYAGREKAALDADKLRLQRAYTATRAERNPVRRRDHQLVLEPLIHRNSRDRMQYADLVKKYTQAVNGASAVLRKVGLGAPTLAGPEVLIVPVVAVAALGAAWAIAYAVHESRVNTSNLIDGAMRVIADPNSTPEQRQQAVDMLRKAGEHPPGPFDLSALTPILGLVAVIMVAPALLSHMPRSNPRRRRRTRVRARRRVA